MDLTQDLVKFEFSWTFFIFTHIQSISANFPHSQSMSDQFDWDTRAGIYKQEGGVKQHF